MDPEMNDKSNNCETEDSTMDSSPISSNNVKEGVKKVLNSTNEDDCSMEVDKEDEQSSNNKNSETKNGVSEKNSDNDTENLKNDCELNNENTSNHEQNEDEKDASSENLVNKEAESAMECDPNESKECEEKEQNSDKKNETVSESSELSNDHDLNSQVVDPKKPTDVEVSIDNTLSKDEVSAEKDSKDNVRPPDKSSNVSSEPIESNDAANSSKDNDATNSSKDNDAINSSKDNDTVNLTKDNSADNSTKNNDVINSSKEHSSNKEDKDSSKSEVSTDGTKDAPKESKDKGNETKETKTESTKKDGETKKKKSKTCEECGVKKGLKFQVLFKGKTRFLCSDTCFKNFKSKQMQSKPPTEAVSAPAPETSDDKCGQCQKELSGDQKYYPVVGETKSLCSEECIKKYHADNLPVKNCSQCKKAVENPHNPDVLTWETMVFCNEDCLGKYQSFLGSHCTCCQSPVPQASLGKYSVCFGADIRQFCSCSCLDDFKKNLKVCSFCQTDLSSGVDSFLAPVGDKGQFKDFCSQNCMERYEVMNNISKNTPPAQVCSHCKKQGTFKIQVKHDNQTFALCGDLCVAGFRCAHKIKAKMCYTCYNFVNMAAEKDKDFSFKFDGQFKQFCTKACMTLFVLSHRKIVACISCKVKKYNFDMIEKQDSNNQTQIFCSLNCLSLYRVSVNAASSKSVRCDNCTKTLPAQYHLTMSDGSVRNFCTYNCVMIFQNQYTNVCTLTTTSATRQTSSSVSTSTSKTPAAASTPVISNVCSLARPPGPTLIRNIVPPKLISARPPLQPLAVIGSKIYTLAPVTRVVTPVMTQNVPSNVDADQQLMANNSSEPAAATITSPSTLTTVTNASGQQVLREVIVKPPAPKSQKNKSVACKPIMQNKGINVKPQPCHKAVQTDDSPRPILLPVPVPYYVPVPIHMFSRPVPCPVPFPVPMFLPIVLPPKDSCNQERKSSDENSSKKVLDENNMKDGSKEGGSAQNESTEKSNSDSIQNAYPSKGDEPNCEATSKECNEGNDYEDDEYVFNDGKNHHHGKRHAHHKNKGHKRSRMDDSVADEVKSHNVVSSEENHNPSVQNDHLEPAPHLKFMFGVNAWKHWVLQKNKQIERGSHSTRKFKLFKTDLLQLPPDELNYSLSLFVKEVRKPDGDEYSPGSLYYLCLGIQKYLFENGRIDNIFSDPYYEKFTECLHDTLDAQERMYKLEGIAGSKFEEEVLWESKQLGAHSPYALLHTIMYFNTKYFKLKFTDDHVRLSFNHMLTVFERKHTDRSDKIGVLRYYPNGKKCEDSDCNHNTSDCIDGPQRDQSENTYKEIENATDSMRCPVRLFEFYLSKCPDSCRDRSDMFYLNPERSCVPDSAVWYSAQPLTREVVNIMIQRIKLIKEIYEK